MAARAFATARRYDWRVIGHSLSGLFYRLTVKPRVRHAHARPRPDRRRRALAWRVPQSGDPAPGLLERLRSTFAAVRAGRFAAGEPGTAEAASDWPRPRSPARCRRMLRAR